MPTKCQKPPSTSRLQCRYHQEMTKIFMPQAKYPLVKINLNSFVLDHFIISLLQNSIKCTYFDLQNPAKHKNSQGGKSAIFKMDNSNACCRNSYF